MATKYARWTHRMLPHRPEPTMRVTLRAGKRGTGRRLGVTVELWKNSGKSIAEADRFCARIEADAQVAGYTILPDANLGEDTP